MNGLLHRSVAIIAALTALVLSGCGGGSGPAPARVAPTGSITISIKLPPGWGVDTAEIPTTTATILFEFLKEGKVVQQTTITLPQETKATLKHLPLGPGKARVTAFAADGATVVAIGEKDIDVEGGVNNPVSITLTRVETSGTVKGTVRDQNATPLQGAKVVTMVDADEFSALTGADGAYSLGSVPAGQRELTFSYQGYETKHTVTVIAGGEVQQNATINLPPPVGTIKGTVMDQHGLPIQGARVSLHDGSTAHQTFTAVDGSYQITNVLAGSHTVQFAYDVHQVQHVVAVVKDQETIQNAVIDLPSPGSRVYGTVTNPAGAPIKDALVATSDGQNPISTLTGPNGYYELNGVPDGTRVISFAHQGQVAQHRVAVVDGQDVRQDAVLDDSGDPPPVALPVITASDPTVNQITGVATITGTITGLSQPTAVYIHNGEEDIFQLGGTQFALQLALNKGENRIQIRATNAHGTVLSRVLTANLLEDGTFWKAILTYDNREWANLHIWHPDALRHIYPDKWGGFRNNFGEMVFWRTFGGPNIFHCNSIDPAKGDVGTYRVGVWMVQHPGPRDFPSCLVRIITGEKAAGPPSTQVFGPHQFTGAQSYYQKPSHVKQDSPWFWRPCDVVVAPDGTVAIVPPDTSVLLYTG